MSEPQATRREFIAGAVTLGISLPILNAQVSFPSATPTVKGPITTTLKPDALAADKGDDSHSKDGFILTRVGKDVYAVDTRCTHKGCAVALPRSKSLLICPCHGAHFLLTGAVDPNAEENPARGPLAVYAVSVDATGLLVVDTSKKLKSGDAGTVVKIP
ncbi:MAG: Rieske (2Fe-2S) protein [Phycisphaerae bacterium]